MDKNPGEPITRYPAGWNKESSSVETTSIAFSPWAIHSALVRRDRFNEMRRWQQSLDGGPSEDTGFWFRILVGADVAWSASSGAIYRKTTPSSRNEIRDLNHWFNGMCAAVDSNIEYLARLGKRPTCAQRVTLVRVFEGEYERALSAGNIEVARRALSEARRYLSLKEAFVPGMLLRYIMGLERFSHVRRSLRSWCRKSLTGSNHSTIPR
jgi:hypothetical protein